MIAEMYWQKSVTAGEHSREKVNVYFRKNWFQKTKKTSSTDQKGEMSASNNRDDQVKLPRWPHQTTEMTTSKRYFDDKFSRKFLVKVPFWPAGNSRIFIYVWLLTTYKNQLKFAKMKQRCGPFQKIACIWPQKCQFIQQKYQVRHNRSIGTVFASWLLRKLEEKGS